MDNLSKLERFDNTLNSLEDEMENLKKASGVFSTLKTLIKTYGDIGEQQKNTVKLIEEIKKSNDDSLEALRKENRNNYFELEKTTKIKLEENKSQIERLIEAERQKVKEIFIEELDKRISAISKSQKELKTTILIVSIITILLMVAIIVIQLR